MFVAHPKLLSFSFQDSNFNSFEDRENTKRFSLVRFWGGQKGSFGEVRLSPQAQGVWWFRVWENFSEEPNFIKEMALEVS